MSRLKRFTHSLLSGYVLLGANMLYTLGSVPLMLHYLTRAEFGLCATITQLAAYIALVDLGLSSAMARLLIDYKDEKTEGEYGSLVQTSFLVAAVQGIIVLAASLALILAASHLADVPAVLDRQFRWLMAGQSVLVAAGFFTRIFYNLLWAHQRTDVANYTQAALFPVSFVVLWLSLEWGGGVFSTLWAQAITWGLAALAQGTGCSLLKLFPPAGCWGRPTWARFQEMFAYGKDVFLFTLGSQMINASQAIIVARCLGLEAAAIWSICSRTYLVVCQLVWRIFDVASTPLAEMLVRREYELCAQRFRSVTILTASSAVLTSSLFVVCNQTFMRLWTEGAIGWSAWNDLLLGIWAVLIAIQRCHVGMLGAKKQLQVVKYIYFVEGAMFVGLALLFTRSGGFSALIGSSIISTLTCSFLYGSRQTMKDFHVNFRELVRDWMGPAMRLAALLAPLSAAFWGVAMNLPAIPALAMMVAGVGGLGGVLFVRLGLDASMQKVLAQKIPPKWAAVFGLPPNAAGAGAQ